MEAGTKLEAVPRKLKLLIVDDEPAVNETLSLIFKRRGFEILTSLTGKRALEQLVEHSPDIVLLDVVLPDISGIEIAIAIIREFPKTKFLLLSGNKATENALDVARDKGFDFQVLAKPLPPEELIGAVETLARQISKP